MKMKLQSCTLAISTILSFAFASTSAQSAQMIPVNVNEASGTVRNDKLFVPEKPEGLLPLVLISPEWWGANEYPEMRAKRIADELGYAALVVDFYGNGKVVETPKEAGALAEAFYKNPSEGVDALKHSVDALAKLKADKKLNLDLSKIVAIGYCFGGTQALNLARAGGLSAPANLLGVVSFHGGLASSLAPKDKIKAKLLVLHGADDKMVSEKDVKAFKAEMKKAHANMEFKAYPGAIHAFTNPKATETGKKYGIPVAYNQAADKDSWEKMTHFLKDEFKK
jgi:dienelactone hydrolase